MSDEKLPIYIEGVGWRYPTEHRMTRWPDWKDSRLPGTYMFTLNINGGQKILGRLEGTTAVIRQWMSSHPNEVQAASSDPLYYRHATLGTRPMPFILKTTATTAATAAATTATTAIASAVETATNKYNTATPYARGTATPRARGIATPVAAALVQHRFDDVAQAQDAPPLVTPRPHRKTHFPLPALSQPDAPHIALSPLGERVLQAWQRMKGVVPEIQHIALAIMPNHLHAVIAVHKPLPRAIGAIIRSFMGTTSHYLHQMMADGTAQWDPSVATLSDRATPDKPNLWAPRFCVGICQTEERLHTRIGYVMENPFFGILEQEQCDMMQRAMHLTIAGRTYGGYGNMLLLKEPDRLQVFCHRSHPVTREPYHLTQDFRDEKADILNAISNGAVIVTPGISPGEADIMLSVLEAGGSVINIQKDEIPISPQWHPKKEYRLYCSCGQMLVLAVHDLPHQTFYDRWGQQIPTDCKYARFHLLNLVAAEICAEGVEHACTLS